VTVEGSDLLVVCMKRRVKYITAIQDPFAKVRLNSSEVSRRCKWYDSLTSILNALLNLYPMPSHKTDVQKANAFFIHFPW
jgi:hypothetical protein